MGRRRDGIDWTSIHTTLHVAVILNGILEALWRLLEITDHVRKVTYVTIARGLMNVVVLSLVAALVPEFNLVVVAWVFNIVTAMCVVVAYCMAVMRGWLKPFDKGLFRTLSLENTTAIKQMMKQAAPLAISYFFSSADWAVLTAMAAFLGPAEVAAWAILGQIWDLLYHTTCGIADSGEIRVANHLGDGRPKMAQLSAYKSFLIGMIVAIITSIVYFLLQKGLPGWFTHDETLIAMLQELVPFVGVANLSMTFGMQCWSLIGAQGKYKLATWVSFVSSWGVTMPLAAVFVYALRIDLQGLMSATTIGYTTCGAALSYFLLSTDWEKQARKIRGRNAQAEEKKVYMAPVGKGCDDELEDELWAALPVRGVTPKTGAFRRVRILVVPAYKRCGILFGNIPSRAGPFVLEVRHWSPLFGRVQPGDALLSIGGEDAANMDSNEIASMLDAKKTSDCELVFVAQWEGRGGEQDAEAIPEDNSPAESIDEPFGIFCSPQNNKSTNLLDSSGLT